MCSFHCLVRFLTGYGISGTRAASRRQRWLYALLIGWALCTPRKRHGGFLPTNALAYYGYRIVWRGRCRAHHPSRWQGKGISLGYGRCATELVGDLATLAPGKDIDWLIFIFRHYAARNMVAMMALPGSGTTTCLPA